MTSPDRDFPRSNDVEESRSAASADHDSTHDSAPDAAASAPGDEAAPGRRGKKGKKPKKQLPLWQETILLMVTALAMALLVKTFFVQAFYIPSESMEPGLVRNDRILVQKVSYWAGEPERGDVVVFKDPGGWLPDAASEPPSNPVALAMTKIGLYPEGGHLVKRVIGVAGDVVACCDEDGNISVNGQSLDEKAYLQDEPRPCNGPMMDDCDWETTTVPEGHLFVMGDNRAHSADSSRHMCSKHETECVPGAEFVPVENVVGRLGPVIWPLKNMRLDHRPEVFETIPDKS